MRFPTSIAGTLTSVAAIALLAGCSGNGAQSAIGTAAGTSQQSLVTHHTRYPVLSPIPKGQVIVRNTHLRFDVGPDAFVKGGVYAGEFAATTINEYGLPNKTNKAPRCQLSGINSPNGINVD